MKSSILWNRYPELVKITSDQPSVSSSSTELIGFTCSCGVTNLISPANLLLSPFCDGCEDCLITTRMHLQDVIKLTRHAIQTSTNYFEFNQLISRLPSATRGDAQEIFAKHYFEAYKKHFNMSTYCSRLLKDKVPEGLSNSDLGSDGIIIHSSGEFSLVQVKFRSDWTASLHRNCLGGASLEALALPNFSKLYLFSNTVVPPKNITVAEQSKLKYIMMTDLYNCDWSRIQESVLNQGELVRSTPPSLYKWQMEAREHVLRKTSEFGKKTVVAMCGSGKTVFGNTILEKYNSVLIVVPNLQLLGQWFERIASWNPERQFLLVGSDLDDVCESIPYTLTTDSSVIASHGRDNLVCISTYQSLDLLVDTSVFDLAIVDEAHVTCGTGVTNFTLIHRQLLARNKLFLTATPKIYNVASDDFVSMNDAEKFGAMYTYSCKEAIDDGIVSNYKIVIGHGRGSNHEEFNAQFLCESVRKHSLNSVLVCSVSHKASKELYNQVQKIGLPSHELLLMPASATSAHKNRAIGYANSRKPVIIFNVRVFSLGTDIPSLESVMILGDRKSVIDTVQTVSRCLRKYSGKEYGYILIPCLLSGEGDMEEEGDYINVRRIISSMGSVDSALVETVVLRGSGGRGIICSSVGTSEVVREVDTDMDFELALYDSMGEREFSVEFKFAKLIEFCEKEGRLPKAKEVCGDVNIGSFLDCLTGGKYKETGIDMLIQLKGVNEEIKTQLDKRLENRNDPVKKVSRTLTVENRFFQLLEFCKKNGRLPKVKEIWNMVKIGSFLQNVFDGKLYKETREEMLDQLKGVSEEIKTQVNDRLSNINDPKKKMSRTTSVEKRFSTLLEFCKENGRLPFIIERFDGVNIGAFLGCLLRTGYKETREEMLDQLKGVSEEIKTQVNDRLSNINDPKKKMSRTTSVEKRFSTLLEFCKENGRLPKAKEKWDEIKVGNFLSCLTGGIYKERVEMLNQLKGVSEEIKTQVNARLSNINDPVKKVSRFTAVKKRFSTLIEFCKEKGRLPKVKEEWNEIKVGVFSNNLLEKNDRLKAQRATYLEQLSQISPEIREVIESRAKP